jgi:hypothetical protein
LVSVLLFPHPYAYVTFIGVSGVGVFNVGVYSYFGYYCLFFLAIDIYSNRFPKVPMYFFLCFLFAEKLVTFLNYVFLGTFSLNALLVKVGFLKILKNFLVLLNIFK